MTAGRWRTVRHDPKPPPERYVDLFEIGAPRGLIEVGPCDDIEGNLCVCVCDQDGEVSHWVSFTPAQANELAEAIMTIVATELE